MSTKPSDEGSAPPTPAPSYIFRRIDFLLLEARSLLPKYDRAVVYAMREISNWCAVGKTASSREIKLKNPRMSREAYKKWQTPPTEDWYKHTTNEHQEPLKQVWEWIRSSKDVTKEEVLARFQNWPMITVTKDEDVRLHKYRDSEPCERYQLAGIEVGLRDKDGWKPLSTTKQLPAPPSAE